MAAVPELIDSIKNLKIQNFSRLRTQNCGSGSGNCKVFVSSYHSAAAVGQQVKVSIKNATEYHGAELQSENL